MIEIIDDDLFSEDDENVVINKDDDFYKSLEKEFNLPVKKNGLKCDKCGGDMYSAGKTITCPKCQIEFTSEIENERIKEAQMNWKIDDERRRENGLSGGEVKRK